jgi:hypothetical protein
MYVEFIFLPDFLNFGEVFTAWLQAGLTSLIFLLALKPGNRASTNLPPQEARHLAQVQG